MNEEYDLSRNEYFKGKSLGNHLDPLTGVLTRESLEGYVKWLIDRGHNFSFCLIDIDNFKNVNDTFGHLVGDIIIEQTAKRLVKNAGDEAVVARYGGDEFIIIRDNLSDYDGVWTYAHSTIKNQGEKISYDCIPEISVTFTLGISRYPVDGGDYETLFNLADKALYRGKTKGRNCFIIYLPEKHAHLDLHGERDKRMKIMQQSLAIFSGLTACGEDLSIAITNVFKNLLLNYMFDHICLESPKKINHSVVFTLSEQKHFSHIPISSIDPLCGGAGYVNINDAAAITNQNFNVLIDEYRKQKIRSALYCKISAYGENYGYIRVDTTNTNRVWQNEEISMVIVAANALGIILHYQHKTLDNLTSVLPIEISSVE